MSRAPQQRGEATKLAIMGGPHILTGEVEGKGHRGFGIRTIAAAVVQVPESMAL